MQPGHRGRSAGRRGLARSVGAAGSHLRGRPVRPWLACVSHPGHACRARLHPPCWPARDRGNAVIQYCRVTVFTVSLQRSVTRWWAVRGRSTGLRGRSTGLRGVASAPAMRSVWSHRLGCARRPGNDAWGARDGDRRHSVQRVRQLSTVCERLCGVNHSRTTVRAWPSGDGISARIPAARPALLRRRSPSGASRARSHPPSKRQ